LCAARYEKQSNGIKLEDKDEVKKLIGRSPDLADAYVMANWGGVTAFGAALTKTVSADRRVQPEADRLANRLAVRRLAATRRGQGWG
jgi:tmRNA-binding protein